MGGFQFAGAAGLLAVAFAAEGCFLFPDPGIDLARNQYIYSSPGYHAPRRTEGAVFIQRLADRREVPDMTKGDTLVQVFPDTGWERPVPVMVEELLIEEIDRSGIYNGMSTGTEGAPRPGDYVIEPTLLALYRYREAQLQGSRVGRRRSVAFASLRLRVHGPAGADGKRPLLLDQVFPGAAGTAIGLQRPEEGYLLAGQAMRSILAKALPTLYESNIRPVGAESVTTEASATNKTDPKK